MEGQAARPPREDSDALCVNARLRAMVAELAGFADDGRRPALINLLIDLRQQAALRQLPASLVRLAMPLALLEAGIVPKAAHQAFSAAGACRSA